MPMLKSFSSPTVAFIVDLKELVTLFLRKLGGPF